MATKTFKNGIIEADQKNPAEAFITMPANKEPAPAPEPVKADAQRERKSARVNLLFKPSVKANIEKLATMNKTSLNDMIGIILEGYIEENAETINQYNSIFSKE